LAETETHNTYITWRKLGRQPEMTVFVSSGTGFVAGKHIFPVHYEAEVSQRLVDASHNNDLKSAYACIADPFVDVNFMGTVSLKVRKTEIVLHEESAHEVRVEYEEFKTDVTALFLASHSGNLKLVRMLLVMHPNCILIYVFRLFTIFLFSFFLLYIFYCF
jgi:hypothetical protein